jgi:hypothetical protein
MNPEAQHNRVRPGPWKYPDISMLRHGHLPTYLGRFLIFHLQTKTSLGLHLPIQL